MMLMDVLACSTRRNKERKVVFFAQALVSGSGGRKGQGCVPPLHSSRVIYLIVFSPPAHGPAGAATAHKGWNSVKSPRPGLKSGVFYL